MGSRIGLSAIQVGLDRFTVSSNNVANQLTPDFQAQRIEQEDDPNGGVRTTGVRPQGTPAGVDGNNVELAREVVDQIGARTQVQTGAALVRAEDELVGTIIDLLG